MGYSFFLPAYSGALLFGGLVFTLMIQPQSQDSGSLFEKMSKLHVESLKILLYIYMNTLNIM